MKRTIALILALILVAACFAGCADEKNKNDEPAPSPTQSVEPTQEPAQSEGYKPHVMPDPGRENVCLLLRTACDGLTKQDLDKNVPDFVMLYYSLDDGALYLSVTYEGEEHELEICQSIEDTYYYMMPAVTFADLDNDGINEIILQCQVNGMRHMRLFILDVVKGELKIALAFDELYCAKHLDEIGFKLEEKDDETLSVTHKNVDHEILIKLNGMYEDTPFTVEQMLPFLRRIDGFRIEKYQDKDTAEVYNAITVAWTTQTVESGDVYFARFYMTFIYDKASGEYVIADADYKDLAPLKRK